MKAKSRLPIRLRPFHCTVTREHFDRLRAGELGWVLLASSEKVGAAALKRFYPSGRPLSVSDGERSLKARVVEAMEVWSGIDLTPVQRLEFRARYLVREDRGGWGIRVRMPLFCHVITVEIIGEVE